MAHWTTVTHRRFRSTVPRTSSHGQPPNHFNHEHRHLGSDAALVLSLRARTDLQRYHHYYERAMMVRVVAEDNAAYG